MPWSTIATNEVLEEFTPAEQAQLQNIQGSTGSLAKILARTVGAARGSIAAGGNPLAAANTIPDQVRSAVITITRWQWVISLPQLKNIQTKERGDAAAAAQAMLDRIAAGTVKVEIPPNADATTVPTQKPSFPQRGYTAPVRNFTDTTQDG